MNCAEYITAVVHTGVEEGAIGERTAISILTTLIGIMNADGGADHKNKEIYDLFKRVGSRYGWIMDPKEEPQW
jgi:hypothetical protein